MASSQKNLSDVHTENMDSLEDASIGIVTAEWNENITFAMRDACIAVLKKYQLADDSLHSITVPGAFELPGAAKLLLSNKKLDAVICIGCVIKGDTKHDEYISNAVANGIMNLGLAASKPVIFGVLTPNDMQQAIDRSGGIHGNKGEEAAYTAIKMIHLTKEVKHQTKQTIGF